MTIVTAEPIPDGSYSLRVFLGDKVPDESDYDGVLTLQNLGAGVGKISHAHGALSNETNLLIAGKAHELGFRVIQFSTLKGKLVTRHAELIGSDETFNHYSVDLRKVLNA